MRATPTADQDPIDTYVEQAVKAFAAARTLEELKAARLEHAGDRSPLALAARSVGELPPAERAEFRARVERARLHVQAATGFRESELEPGGTLMVLPELPDPTPLPDGPFVWVLTLGPDATYERTAASFQAVVDGLTAALPGERLGDRAHAIVLAHGYTLQLLDDDALRGIGLQRIEGPR